MDTLLSLLIGVVITFFFLRRYLRKLTAEKSATPAASRASSPIADPDRPCPRCNKTVASGSSFCPSCGAALALWNVHRSSVQETASKGDSPAETGKPRPVINATLCIGCGSCVDECPETGTLTLVSGKAILANPALCTGHARCVEVCPTSAISLAFGDALQTLRVPRINEAFESNVSGLYIVGELGGMALIKTAINEGRLVMDRIRQRLEEQGLWTAPDAHADAPPPANDSGGEGPVDVAIVGAGPAGLSAALSAVQHGIRYVVLEQGEIASTIRQYPRQKFLMAEPIEMPLYGSLYVGDGTKESLLAVWEAIIANTGVRVRTQERVESITRLPDSPLFALTTFSGVVRARYVVLALGKRGTPRKLGVPGEDLGKVSYRLIEADSYDDVDILVVGGGDSAIEAALALSKSGKNRVALSYRGEAFSRARERNQQAVREAQDKGRVLVMFNSQLREIREDSVTLDASGETVELPNRYVFIMIGGESPENFLQKTGVEIVERVVSA
jgi:thioredoxin reductase/ferredoxin